MCNAIKYRKILMNGALGLRCSFVHFFNLLKTSTVRRLVTWIKDELHSDNMFTFERFRSTLTSLADEAFNRRYVIGRVRVDNTCMLLWKPSWLQLQPAGTAYTVPEKLGHCVCVTNLAIVRTELI